MESEVMFLAHNTFLELHSKTALQHSGKQLKEMGDLFKNKNNSQKKLLKQMHERAHVSRVDSAFSNQFGITGHM